VRLALDQSASYSVAPTPLQTTAWRALGLERAIVGLYPFNVTKANYICAAWGWAGIPCEEYQFPEALVPTHRPWWVDAELPTATRANITDALRKGARGVYTRRGWWNENQPQWDVRAEFPNAELWDARYVHGDGPCLIVDALNAQGDVRAAMETEFSWLSPFKPYAGFDRAAITQWHNSIIIYGINVDLNELHEEEHMPTPEYAVLYRRDEDIKAVVAKNRELIVAFGNAFFPLAQAVYGDTDDEVAKAQIAELQASVAALEAAG
jgi:hypothetical protein